MSSAPDALCVCVKIVVFVAILAASTAAAAPPPPEGTPLLLARCNASDDAQVFRAAAGAVVHAASGLCVAFDGVLDTSPLALAACSSSAAAQAWRLDASNATLLNPAGSCAGPAGQCLQWAGAQTSSCAADPVLGVGCAVTAWPTAYPTGWNSALLFGAPPPPAPGTIEMMYAGPQQAGARRGASGSGLCASAAPPPPPSPPPLPDADVLAWTELEIGLFISFDMFTTQQPNGNNQHFCLAAGGDRGFAVPPASAYRPARLDTNAWLAAAVALGARYAVLVAQHCSGFSQWPTDISAATGFNYSYSTLSSGGPSPVLDVVDSFVESCRAAGVLPGLYYSLNENYWLNVGAGRVNYQTPLAPGQLNVSQELYNAIAVAQQREIWGRYKGALAELWFDGSQDLPGLSEAIAELQPHAVLQSGSMPAKNIRWVGTETGLPSYPIWSTGSLDANGVPAWGAGDPFGPVFVPAETDTTQSVDDNWFWTPSYRYRTLADLQQSYEASVGANSNLLINLAPDADGAVPAPALELFTQLGAWVRACYGRPAAATTPPPGLVVELALPPATLLDRLVLMEDQTAGEQVLAFDVSVRLAASGAWTPVGAGSAIGHKRIFKLDWAAAADRVRVNVTKTRSADAPVRWRSVAAIDGAANSC